MPSLSAPAAKLYMADCGVCVASHCCLSLYEPFSRFLEDELARRYREAAPATLALLQERCEALAKELLAADGRLQACKDVAALRRAGEAVCSAEV